MLDIASTNTSHHVNGDTIVKDLIFDIPRLIAAISAAVLLEPGDVIATGAARFPALTGHTDAGRSTLG